MLGRFKVLDEVQGRLAGPPGTVAVIAQELPPRPGADRAGERSATPDQRHSFQAAPSLLALAGCGALSAAKVVGEVAGARRSSSKASFARWNGTAPIPIWSADDPHFRLNRGGNRQVNAALHRIALTQWRCVGTPGHDYLVKRMANGDNKKEALRLLRRRLSDEVFRRLLTDEATAIPRPGSKSHGQLDSGETLVTSTDPSRHAATGRRPSRESPGGVHQRAARNRHVRRISSEQGMACRHLRSS